MTTQLMNKYNCKKKSIALKVFDWICQSYVHPQVRYNAIMQAFPPCLADIMQLCKFFLRVFHLISLILFISHFKGLTCLFIHEINYVFVCVLYFIKLIASMHHVTSSRPQL
jgi:hypothetical protein